MHTYLFDEAAGKWSVGYWLDGLFKSVERFETRQDAVYCVNCLNGGITTPLVWLTKNGVSA